MERPLKGTVAVVTGATRGAGRGIAQALGDAGATVYVTGRSTRSAATKRPGTVEDTADEVTARGGVGIPARCDHTVDADVAALFARVEAEQGRLDLLVNNAWGGNERGITLDPFWTLPPSHWDDMFTAGVRAHLMASRFAVPLMLRRGRGLIISTSFYDQGKFLGNLYYDLAKSALNRLAFGMAQQLREHGIAAVALSPGWMRTELVLAEFGATAATWQSVPALAQTESPLYLGRAVAALAAEPRIMERTGQTLVVADLAREYGFTDIDGRYVPPFAL